MIENDLLKQKNNLNNFEKNRILTVDNFEKNRILTVDNFELYNRNNMLIKREYLIIKINEFLDVEQKYINECLLDIKKNYPNQPSINDLEKFYNKYALEPHKCILREEIEIIYTKNTFGEKIIIDEANTHNRHQYYFYNNPIKMFTLLCIFNADIKMKKNYDESIDKQRKDNWSFSNISFENKIGLFQILVLKIKYY